METKNYIRETVLFKEMGRSRNVLIDLRKSGEASRGVHWDMIEGDGRSPMGKGHVAWYPEGLAWLKARFGDWEAPGAWSDVEGAPVGSDIDRQVIEDDDTRRGVRWGKILKMPMNSKLLLIEINGKSEKVLTRDQRLFKVGMEVPVRVLTGGILAIDRYPKPTGRY